MAPSTMIPTVGAALEGTGAVQGTCEGVLRLRRSPWASHYLPHHKWLETLRPKQDLFVLSQADTHAAALSFLSDLSNTVHRLMQGAYKGSIPLILGGDHTTAMGTWHGVMRGMREDNSQARLGLLWIDAHMDLHTTATSHSGRLHGMPLAALLGHGRLLTSLGAPCPALRHEDIALIGIRSYEAEERTYAEATGIRIYYQEEVFTRGLDTVLKEAIRHVSRHTNAYGISFDIDSLDPKDAPGVGTPVKAGLPLGEVLEAFNDLHRVREETSLPLVACEIVEFNAHLDDKDHRTEKALWQVAASLLNPSP